MSDVLLITLEVEKQCAGCPQPIKAGENAIRNFKKETNSKPARVDYFHPDCWSAKHAR